jgi:Protein of unknown function (DUF2867)
VSQLKETPVRPFAIAPPLDTAPALPRADFCDAFAIDVEGPALDAPEAARRAFDRMPGWALALLTMRNAIVRPFGLKTGAEASSPAHRNALFPILSSSPERMVLGFDDAHLDFRIVVDIVALNDNQQRVIATTLVRRNNRFGRAYLATILPFHKAIVPAMLAQISK